MIPYHSFIHWNIGPITIQSYGLMFALAFLAATLLTVHEAKRRNIDPDHVYNIMLCLIIGGLIGGRLMHVLLDLKTYLADPSSILLFWTGGLSWIGGFIGGVLALMIYVRSQNLYFWKLADLLAPSIALGHAIGRIGCILGDGGHLGKITTVSWGVLSNGEVRHLTAAYDLVAELMIFGILIYLSRRNHLRHGHLFSIYVMLYCFQRFFTDFLRIDSVFDGLTATQWICILLFFGFGAYVFRKLGSVKSVFCLS